LAQIGRVNNKVEAKCLGHDPAHFLSFLIIRKKDLKACVRSLEIARLLGGDERHPTLAVQHQGAELQKCIAKYRSIVLRVLHCLKQLIRVYLGRRKQPMNTTGETTQSLLIAGD
jgi:hypothetical protein